jgi:antitoxin Phd
MSRSRNAASKPRPVPAAAKLGDSRVTATEAKNAFGRVLERVIRGEKVFITRHDRPQAVLISVEDYDALASNGKPNLNALTEEFDSLLARMQRPGQRARMRAAFDATPKQLGAAAVKAARKRD